jgi:hypothetical protein
MRELHERDTGDGADTGTDSRPDVATGHGGDSRRAAMPTVHDAATRTALALEYRRRVEAGQDVGGRDDDHRGEDVRSQDMARRPSRGADVPASARELPNARDVLPNLEIAEIDERKFSEYSLNPGHPDNRGKAGGWRALGYDVDSPQGRREAAQELRGIILSELLACGKVEATRDTPRGLSHRVLNGIIGPNGKVGTLVTCWRIEDHPGAGVPRLVTTWAQPHRDKETDQ